MSVGAVGSASGDPVDLSITVSGTDGGTGLVADDSLLVGEGGDGNVAAVCAVGSRGVAITHPGVFGQIDGTTGDPGEDVFVAALVACKAGVGSAHATHGLARSPVGRVLVGDLDAFRGHSSVVGV